MYFIRRRCIFLFGGKVAIGAPLFKEYKIKMKAEKIIGRC